MVGTSITNFAFTGVLALWVLAFSCTERSGANRSAEQSSSERVVTGAAQLVETNFEALQGMRVGLVTNHTALVGTVHLIDLLHSAEEVELGALFGPEHGLRGSVEDGAVIEDGRDTATGVPVYSLYGARRRPAPESLDSLDAIVFDIQDVGARFYTYISTMGLAMQSAAEADIPFYVLDRPNPLGGGYVDGFVREPEFETFVGQYPIPVAHGLTVAELALMIRGEEYLPGLAGLDLRIVAMRNWERSYQWPDTGLEFIPTSPNMPDFETALVYPGMCFFEGTRVSEGRGTPKPFLTIGAPWLDAPSVVEKLRSAQLPGVDWEAIDTVPVTIPGKAAAPKFENESIGAVRIHVADRHAYRPLDTGIRLLYEIYHAAPDSLLSEFFIPPGIDRLAGTVRLRKMIESGVTPEEIAASWSVEVADWKRVRAPYLIY